MLPSSTRIDATQLDNWRSVFQSTKEELVTSFQILDIRRCARNGFRGAPQSGRKPREKPFLLTCWHVWSWGKGLLIPDCYSKCNMPHHFEQESKCSHWKDTILHLPGRNNLRSIRQRARSWSLSYGTLKKWLLRTWRLDGRQSTPTPSSGADIIQGSFSDESILARTKQKSCFIMTMQGRTTIWRPGTPSQNWAGLCYPNHTTAPNITLRFPPIWSPEGCSQRRMQSAVWSFSCLVYLTWQLLVMRLLCK